MKTQAIGGIAGILGIILAVPSPAQDPPRNQQQRAEDLFDQLDETRVQIELLEMEVAADKRQIQKMVDVLTETGLQRVQGFSTGPIIMGNDPEEKEANIAKYKRMLEEVRADFSHKSKELSRARRRLGELEERVGRRGDAKVSNAERRIRAIERIISEILKEVED